MDNNLPEFENSLGSDSFINRKFRPVVDGNRFRGRTIGNSDVEQMRIQIQELYKNIETLNQTITDLEVRIGNLEP